MAGFPYSNEFYNSYENPYNPFENKYNSFDFTSSSYEYFNDNYCINESNWTPQNFQNNDEPTALDKQVESLLESSIHKNQKLSELCNLCKCNNSLLFASLLFTAICKASPDSHFAFLHFFSMGGGLDPCLLYNVMNLIP